MQAAGQDARVKDRLAQHKGPRGEREDEDKEQRRDGRTGRACDAHSCCFLTASNLDAGVCARSGCGRKAPEPEASGVTRSRAEQREERFDRLQEAIDQLPDEYREVLILTRIEGVAVKDVAERLGKTPNAISRMLLLATRKLRDGFGDTASFRLPPRPLQNRAEGLDD